VSFHSKSPVITCFNVKYSPNLGDGLLSECLENALIDAGASTETTSADLAARCEYGDAMLGRGAIMKLLDAMPAPMRKQAVRVPLALHGAMKWRPHYAAALQGADGVVLGGGNLLSDLDLNFPTKIGLSFDEAAKRDLPMAIYACGVGSGWSRAGLKLGRKAFSHKQLRAVFVRDGASKELFDTMFADATGHTAQVVRDPGLLASQYFPAAAKVESARPVAGLNIMSHIAIRYHADNAPGLAQLDEFYIDVARGLVAAGYEVRAFTNGSPEDQHYMAELRPRLEELGTPQDIAFLTQRDPAGLCAHISAFDVLVAYRMHAVIAAYSYRVPVIALEWDRKLNSFMHSVSLADNLLNVASTSAGECVERAVAAHKAGLPLDKHSAVLASAAADVEKLYQCFA